MSELAVPRMVFVAAFHLDFTPSRGILRLPQVKGSRDTQGELWAQYAIIGLPVGVNFERGVVLHIVELCY